MTVGAVAKKQSNFSKILTGIWDEFVYGGHLLSLGASAIVLTGALIVNSNIDIGLILIPYLLSQSVYSFNHYLEIREDLISNPERAKYLQHKNQILLIVFYIGLLVYLLLAYAAMQTFFFIISVLIIGIIYPKKLTANFIGFKNFFVSIIWALSIIFFTMYTNSKFDLAVIILFVFVFLRFMLSTIFFDLKDIASDKTDGLKTIPVIFGIRNTINILNALNILSFLILCISIIYGVLPLFSLSLIIFLFYDFIYVIWGSQQKKSLLRFISYVFVDGEYLLWPIVIIIAKYIIGLICT